MNLSFSSRGWPELSWEEMLELAIDMGFNGVEVYNLHKANAMCDRGGAFHPYQIAATVRQLREKKLQIPCFDTSIDLSTEENAVEVIENLLKIEMARNSAYTICNNAFETLCAHAQSLIAEVSVAPDKFPMADELLNVKKLRNLIDDPTNAGAVLKRMNEDIKEMLVNADYIEKTMYFDTTGNNSEA